MHQNTADLQVLFQVVGVLAESILITDLLEVFHRRPGHQLLSCCTVTG